MSIILITITICIIIAVGLPVFKFVAESMAIYKEFVCTVDFKSNGAYIKTRRGWVHAKYWAEKGNLGYQLTLTDDMHEVKVLTLPAKRIHKLMRDSLADYIQAHHPEIQIVEIMPPHGS